MVGSSQAIPIGWHVTLTNLENQKTIEYTYQFVQPNDVKPTNRFLIGVSLCPVGETIWDPTSSAAFSGVRFIRCILNDEHIFSPNSELMSEGYAQGYPCAKIDIEENTFTLGVNYTL